MKNSSFLLLEERFAKKNKLYNKADAFWYFQFVIDNRVM